ncbi:hypothetical protein BJ508DRAFT_19733 [Ascobolus immersus RN42]|uniref:Uncharacterized protein n=1 Tax=Ascobolus immersus RN42 TaxID=1160509 RepID=A0A3N4IL76_ASCIM|nr:hypothetical protein BJ508DRAFT_19733 [Ascobolus immersus RN42]
MGTCQHRRFYDAGLLMDCPKRYWPWYRLLWKVVYNLHMLARSCMRIGCLLATWCCFRLLLLWAILLGRIAQLQLQLCALVRLEIGMVLCPAKQANVWCCVLSILVGQV